MLDDAGSKLSDARATVEQTARDAVSKARGGVNTASARMQERPLLAIGIALGVGYLLGRLIGERRPWSPAVLPMDAAEAETDRRIHTAEFAAACWSGSRP